MTSETTPHSSAAALPPLVTRLDEDPAVLAEAAADDYALHVVPRTWRLGKGKLAVAWSATLAALIIPVYASIVASIVGPKQALIGMILATLVFWAICFPLQRVATQTGVTLATFSRSLFGLIGAPIASLVFVVAASVFTVFEGSVLAVGLQTYFGGSIYLWYGVVAAFCTLIALFGFRVWLERLNAWLLPLFLVGFFGALIWSIAEYGYQSDWINAEGLNPSPFAGPGWLIAFALYMVIMSNVFYVFDFARMGRPEDVKYNGHVTFGGVYWALSILGIGGIGIYLSHAIPVQGLSEVALVTGIVQMMGIWGVIYILATQTKIQTANVYLASLNLQVFFSRTVKLTLSRKLWTVVVGIGSFAIMSADIFTFLNELLTYQGVLACAWVAVAMVHLLYRRTGAPQQRFETRPGRVPRVNPGGLAGWAAGSIVGVVLVAWGPASYLTYALIITYVVSTAVYGGALLFAQPGWFSLVRPFDPAGEVGDPWDIRVQCHKCQKSYVAVEMDRDPNHNHEAICASCAIGDEFQAAAHSESDRTRR